MDFPGLETARKVQCDFPTAFAEACAEALLPASPNKEFRFVLCSGAFAVRDRKKSLRFMKDTRQLKASESAVIVSSLMLTSSRAGWNQT
jgi:hypothetical protein